MTPEQVEKLLMPIKIITCDDDLELDELIDGTDENCPNCGREYDEIDFEFQICHRCGFNNN